MNLDEAIELVGREIFAKLEVGPPTGGTKILPPKPDHPVTADCSRCQ